MEGAIGGNAYQHNKVNQWTSSVVEQCLNQLTKLGKPFKYIGKEQKNDGFLLSTFAQHGCKCVDVTVSPCV